MTLEEKLQLEIVFNKTPVIELIPEVIRCIRMASDGWYRVGCPAWIKLSEIANKMEEIEL